MKGVPLRLELGPRDLQQGNVCLVKRVNGEKRVAPIEEIEKAIPSILDEIHEDMYKKALDFLHSHIKEAHDVEELKAILNEGGYAKMCWCGDEECELKVKEITAGGTARCIGEGEEPFESTCPICGKKATKVVYFAKAY